MTVVSCSTATVETEAEMSCRSAAASIIIYRLVSYSVRALRTSEWDFQSRGGARGGILAVFQQEAPWAMGNVWCTKLYALTNRREHCHDGTTPINTISYPATSSVLQGSSTVVSHGRRWEPNSPSH